MRLVFLVGPPRSGTTLLQSILAANAEVTSLPETHYFEWVLPKLGGGSHSPDAVLDGTAISRAQELLKQSGLHFTMDSREGFGDSQVTARSLFEEILRQCALDRKCPIFLEKTPGHVRHLPLLREFYPQCKVIAMVRHPVESVGSMLAQKPLHAGDWRLRYVSGIRQLARHWVAHCEPILRHKDLVDCVIRYEDLVQNLEAEVRRACDVIGVPFGAGMLNECWGAAGALVDLRLEPWKRQNTAGRLLDHRQKWRGRLSRGRQWLIEEEVAGVMDAFGYERAEMPNWMERTGAQAEESVRRFVVSRGVEKKLRRTIQRIAHRHSP